MINNLLITLASFSLQKALLAGLVAGGLYYFLLYNDGSIIQKQITEVQAEISKEEMASAESDAALREVEQVRIAVGALTDQFKLVSAAIPADIQMADIIRAIDTVAKAAGVVIKSKEPRINLNKDFYEEIPLDITLEGGYSQIAMFMYYTTSMERIMRVRNFTLSRATESASKGSISNSGKLSFDGQIVSFRFIGNAAPKPEGGK